MGRHPIFILVADTFPKKHAVGGVRCQDGTGRRVLSTSRVGNPTRQQAATGQRPRPDRGGDTLQGWYTCKKAFRQRQRKAAEKWDVSSFLQHLGVFLLDYPLRHVLFVSCMKTRYWYFLGGRQKTSGGKSHDSL